MAKIGTAHVEVKPVLNHEALEQICDEIETAIRRAVERGLRDGAPAVTRLPPEPTIPTP